MRLLLLTESIVPFAISRVSTYFKESYVFTTAATVLKMHVWNKYPKKIEWPLSQNVYKNLVKIDQCVRNVTLTA